MNFKIAAYIALAVLLQSVLPYIWSPLVYVDLPLIIAVYFALRRNAVQAVIIATAAGLATDALSKSLLGGNGFSKTLVAYLIATMATRVMVDNPLARIPVLAGATVLDATAYVLLHRLLGQPSMRPFMEVTAFKLIATTVAGTLIFTLLDRSFSDRVRTKRQFAFRRRAARRSLGRRRV